MGVYAMRIAQVITTVEGLLGFALNIVLLVSLLRLSNSIFSSANVHRIPIFISSIQGAYLGLAVAIMNYVHIFREGTFVLAMLGPLVPIFPVAVCNVAGAVSFVFTTMMWTLIPSTATIQFIALTRPHFSTKERLIASFSFTIISVVYVSFLTPSWIPLAEFPEFTAFIDRITRDLYKIDPSRELVLMGSTITRPELNGGRSMLLLLVFFVTLPYVSSYAYFLIMAYKIRKRLNMHGASISERTMKMQKSLFLMQKLQGFLPLAFISVPFVVFVIGAILHANLDFITLLFTFFLWFCPVIQAAVQLKFVRESKRASETSPASVVSAITVTVKSAK